MRHLLTLIVIALFLASCQAGGSHDTPISTIEKHASRCYLVITGHDTTYLENKLDIEWPASGQLRQSTETEMLRRLIGDSTSSTIEEACAKHLNQIWVVDNETPTTVEAIDDSAITEENSYHYLTTTCRNDAELLHMTAFSQIYDVAGVHGSYDFQSVTYDRKRKKFIEISDLLDTNTLRLVIRRAIDELDENNDVKESLYERYDTEYMTQLYEQVKGTPDSAIYEAYPEPLPLNFTFEIGKQRTQILLTYPLYSIAPYSCGIQTVVMPIAWLSQQVELTSYAKKLFKL
ncbi:MAG: DUF3298 domain-containing protein [Bacteroidales bacterium]|nr:DUF3298 domain-containing protein [Bacteroidales bacterium]